MSRIEQLVTEFREYVNNPRIRDALYRQKGRWFQICSSMDAIGDAELAIAAFREGNFASKPELYLALYGLFQSLFVQQDATSDLLEGLGLDIDLERFPRTQEIREIRNLAFGHPTKYERGRRDAKITKHSFIVRISLGKDSFELHETDAASGTKYHTYNTAEIIRDHASDVERALRDGLTRLQEEDLEHRVQFRSEPLTGCFPTSLSWSLGKVGEAASGAGLMELSRVGVAEASSALDCLEATLKKRGLRLETYDVLKHTASEARLSLATIESWIDGSSEYEPHIILILVRDLQQKFETLRRVSKEIDEEYAED